MTESIEYFFAEFDYRLKNGYEPKEALLQTAEDYAHVIHDILPKDEIIKELRQALLRSLELQSHYAKLLNMHDGGERIGFASIEAWLERIKTTEPVNSLDPSPAAISGKATK
jgi:hypothetical protein